MELAVILLGAVSLVELSMWLTPLWYARKLLSGVLVVTTAASSSAIVFLHPRIWTCVFASITLYRLFNLVRLVDSRVQADFLRRTTRRTSQSLIGLQALVLLIDASDHLVHINDTSRWTCIAALQLLAGLVLTISTRRHLQTTKTLGSSKVYVDRALPTLSVAIPARNETKDLERCLQAVIASDYPKLEILVLDDCSQNKRTPEIIRKFAHDGVRFIAGTEPSENWLAKNFAYEQLVEAASGELLLFCGVDVIFEPNALRILVSTLLEKQKSMLSVLPRNAAPQGVQTYLLQPARYAWELSLPRRLFNRPPVLSTCWLVKRSLLASTGSFKAASRSISPESYFARAARVHDGYSFVRSNVVLSNKPFNQQLDTTVRTRYPQLHRRPELVCLVSIAESGLLIAPFVLSVAAIVQHWILIAILSSLASALMIGFYSAVVAVTYRQFRWWNLVLVPFAALYDIGLLNFSMWKYEFSEVLWKGRNVCLPVMRVIPALPTVATKS